MKRSFGPRFAYSRIEPSPSNLAVIGRYILTPDIFEALEENIRIARKESTPLCQDTGFAVLFVEMGQEVAVRRYRPSPDSE